jgi:hypothetical protein
MSSKVPQDQVMTGCRMRMNGYQKWSFLLSLGNEWPDFRALLFVNHPSSRLSRRATFLSIQELYLKL